MADIVLAELNGGFWLVRGVVHIDALLANTLADDVAVEIVVVEDRAEINALWLESGETQDNAQPWMIHPAIGRRVRGQFDARSVAFTPWSAMIDAAGQETIDAVASWMKRNPPARLLLRQFAPAEPPPGLVDLQRLRGQLVAAALGRAGLHPADLDQETAVSDAHDENRLDFVTAQSLIG